MVLWQYSASAKFRFGAVGISAQVLINMGGSIVPAVGSVCILAQGLLDLEGSTVLAFKLGCPQAN